MGWLPAIAVAAVTIFAGVLLDLPLWLVALLVFAAAAMSARFATRYENRHSERT